MNSQTTVLVVDDNIKLAKEYAELICNGCGFGTIAASSPDEAKEYVKKYPIRVVVLDYLMPVKGPDLFREMKVINSKLHALIITGGQKDIGIVIDAESVGIVDFLKKNMPTTEMINKVFLLNLRYERALLEEKMMKESISINKTYCRGFFKRKYVERKLIGYDIINEMHIKDNGWISYKTISSGEKQILRKEISVENSLTVSSSNRISQTLGLSLKDSLVKTIASDLQKTLEDTIGISTINKNTTTVTTESEIILPDNSLSGRGRILERSFECAQIYKEIRVFIDEYCSCCNNHNIVTFVVCLPTDNFMRRIIETTEKGKNIIDSSICTRELL